MVLGVLARMQAFSSSGGVRWLWLLNHDDMEHCIHLRLGAGLQIMPRSPALAMDASRGNERWPPMATTSLMQRVAFRSLVAWCWLVAFSHPNDDFSAPSAPISLLFDCAGSLPSGCKRWCRKLGAHGYSQADAAPRFPLQGVVLVGSIFAPE